LRRERRRGRDKRGRQRDGDDQEKDEECSRRPPGLALRGLSLVAVDQVGLRLALEPAEPALDSLERSSQTLHLDHSR
jgi:hypothetical protein